MRVVSQPSLTHVCLRPLLLTLAACDGRVQREKEEAGGVSDDGEDSDEGEAEGSDEEEGSESGSDNSADRELDAQIEAQLAAGEELGGSRCVRAHVANPPHRIPVCATTLSAARCGGPRDPANTTGDADGVCRSWWDPKHGSASSHPAGRVSTPADPNIARSSRVRAESVCAVDTDVVKSVVHSDEGEGEEGEEAGDDDDEDEEEEEQDIKARGGATAESSDDEGEDAAGGVHKSAFVRHLEHELSAAQVRWDAALPLAHCPPVSPPYPPASRRGRLPNLALTLPHTLTARAGGRRRRVQAHVRRCISYVCGGGGRVPVAGGPRMGRGRACRDAGGGGSALDGGGALGGAGEERGLGAQSGQGGAAQGGE